MKNRVATIEKIFSLRTSGYTFQEIAQLCGVSRQRIHQIYLKSPGAVRSNRPHKPGRPIPPELRAEYRAYHAAFERCTNENHPNYCRYGGRGIEFRFKSFEEFIVHIGHRPSVEHSLDRINNNGNYEAGNVRWTTADVQRANRRSTKGRKWAYRITAFPRRSEQTRSWDEGFLL
jgi:hypothetical protein